MFSCRRDTGKTWCVARCSAVLAAAICAGRWVLVVAAGDRRPVRLTTGMGATAISKAVYPARVQSTGYCGLRGLQKRKERESVGDEVGRPEQRHTAVHRGTAAAAVQRGAGLVARSGRRPHLGRVRLESRAVVWRAPMQPRGSRLWAGQSTPEVGRLLDGRSWGRGDSKGKPEATRVASAGGEC